MRDIFELEKSTVVLQDVSYLTSYPFIVQYFQQLETIAGKDVVLGAHMVYGWMPTILDLYLDDQNLSLDGVVQLCNKAKGDTKLNGEELGSLSSAVNNSLVGASKLLHFINPETYPIWDSKIYTFIHENKPHSYRVNDTSLYLSYVDQIERLQEDEQFTGFHLRVNEKIGYDVTGARAAELIMFLNAPRTS